MSPMPLAGLRLRYDAPLTACPMCGSGTIGYFDHDFERRTMFRCRECETKFMNPQYSDECLEEIYSQYITELPGDDAQRYRRRTISKTDDLRLVGRHIRPGKLLSIGCGDGLELELAKGFGWDAEGYDVDLETTRRVSERLGMPVHTGDFFDLRLPAESYDCIFMDQVLEHPKTPQLYLHEVHRLLRPGGVLFIGCPNIYSATMFMQTFLGRLGLKRRRGRHYGMFHHLFYYAPWQLARVLEQHYHFSVEVTEGDPLCGEGRRKFEGTLLDGLANTLCRRLPFLEGTFRLIARKVAVERAPARRVPELVAA